MISAGGRLSRKRFIVRLGRYAGTAPREDGVVGIDPKSRSIDPDSNGRCGELKVLEDAKENSDSERLRFRTIVGVGRWLFGGKGRGRDI